MDKNIAGTLMFVSIYVLFPENKSLKRSEKSLSNLEQLSVRLRSNCKGIITHTLTPQARI